MFGRSKSTREETLKERMGRKRRRARGHEGAEKGREAFSDFVQAISNVARGQAFYYADHYRNQAAQLVDDFASSLRDTGMKRDPDGETPSLADDIAEDLEDLSDVIRDLRLSSALAEVEQLARRKPLIFGIGALAAGYLVTRIVRRGSSDTQGREKRGWRF